MSTTNYKLMKELLCVPRDILKQHLVLYDMIKVLVMKPVSK